MPKLFIFLLYRLLLAGASPFILAYLLLRSCRNPRYWNRLGERFGYLPAHLRCRQAGAIWIHAVSVGEVLSARGLVRILKNRFPERKVFLSVTTLAGRAVAEEKFQELADGVFYAPLDYAVVIRRVLRRLRPAALVIMETEIWPNLWREAKRSGCGLLLVNGRISDRAAPHYLRLRWLLSPVLRLADRIQVQTGIAGERFRALGASPERLELAGNLKYDFDAAGASTPEILRALLDRLKPCRVWIAASTMPPAGAGDVDEDDAVLDAFEELSRRTVDLLLILVPRKPERFDEVAARLRARGIPHLRRSSLAAGMQLALPGVLLLDSIGELAGLFCFADVVFMGGTLARRGGHNILEPAFFGKPVICGPHMENFPEIQQAFREAGAIQEIAVAGDLAPAVERILASVEVAGALGARARAAAESQRGATAKALAAVEELLAAAMPVHRLPQPLDSAAWAAARLWGLGNRIARRWGQARRRSLPKPVISVGALSVGGAGKTSMVLALAGMFHAASLTPCILTRGYRRRRAEAVTIVRPGRQVGVETTGDEGQLFLRSGLAIVGIGADRWRCGAAVLQQCGVDVFILDDGFQHWPLERDLDIVVVDVNNPWDGGDYLPRGRLRELPDALRRAGCVVLTHTRQGQREEALEKRIGRWNPRAPIFYSRLALKGIVDANGALVGDPGMLAQRRVAAFCGLGNPESFWRSLEEARCRLVLRRAFPDHHPYSRGDVQALAAEASRAGAEWLITTEKDFVRIPRHGLDLEGGLPLLRLMVAVELDAQDQFQSFLFERLKLAARPVRPAAGHSRG